jgi:cob(I)alamin adenosyltransferase
LILGDVSMPAFYTRTGDDGYTGLLGEGRVPKYHPVTEAVGAIDEAAAALGIGRAACRGELSPALILAVQRDLYHLMAEIAATPENVARFRQIDASRVNWLEAQTDTLSSLVELPKDFILPGDSTAGAALALARTVVRRAERRVAYLYHEQLLENPDLLRYLNRLSSLCFVLELYENQTVGVVSPTLARQD